MIQIAGGVIWNPNKGVAIVNQNNNSWSLPKGHVEAGETIFDAALREITEETGIPQNALTYIRKVEEYERPKIKRDENEAEEIRHISLFLFITEWEDLSPIDPENPEACWVPPEKVPAMLTHPIDKMVFERMIDADIFSVLKIPSL